MKLHYKIIILLLLFAGIGLRLSLFWFNPPQNSFDDHFEPIYLIMKQGKIPEKNACWECNQPFLFYVAGAGIADLSKKMGASNQQIIKIIQFLPCLYGILTLPLILLILNIFPLSPFARIIPFGIVCFLPRHIYMSAMLTNDTLSYLFVTLSVYLLLKAIEKNYSPRWLLVLSVSLALAIFTKYTALVVLPMAGAVFLFVYIMGTPISRRRSICLFSLVLLVPLIFLTPYMFSNYKKYDNPLPTNLELNNVKLQYIPGSGINYFNFKPWEVIKTPIIAPDNVRSFWTGIQGRMWFDMEPKFINFTDPDRKWWVGYLQYIVGRPVAFPDIKHLSATTRFLGSSLIAVGLIPTVISLLGFFYAFLGRQSLWPSGEVLKGMTAVSALTVLFLTNAAGIIMHTMKFPYYSHMKAVFMLISLPAFAVFLGIGTMALEKNKVFKILISITFIIICFLVTLHISLIVKALFSMPIAEKNLMLYAIRNLIKI